MPRYFFHLCRDDVKFPDDAGQTLKDPDQAWEAARATALDLMNSDEVQETSWSTYRFEVTDESGNVLLEFPFLEAIEIGSQPS
jgi:hypothetical protein